MGLGSSWYHLDPSNETLLWDRLPISIAFMAFLSAVLAERLDRRAGIVSLLPLIAFGIFSVLYWYFTERAGAGDLRYYIVAQGYPLLFVPLMVRLLPSPYTRGSDFYLAALFYLLAKAAELLDQPIYEAVGFVSGHYPEAPVRGPGGLLGAAHGPAAPAALTVAESAAAADTAVAPRAPGFAPTAVLPRTRLLRRHSANSHNSKLRAAGETGFHGPR